MQNLILLHGALGSSDDLAHLATALKRTGTTVHTFSFSGHAKIPFETDFGIEQFAEELETFILKNNLRDSCIFGYSMGGFVAMYFAAKQKNLIQKIITLGTKFNWSKESVDKETKMLDPELMLEKVPAYAKSLEAKHGKHWKELVLKTALMMKKISEKKLLNEEEIKNLNTPVLLGLADKDQMVSLDETRHVFSSLPDVAMYMLPGSKHPIESVNIDLLSEIIFDFVKNE